MINKKYQKLIITICIFILCIPFHFLYEWAPLDLFVCFLPVNGSLFEHMKLLFTTIFVGNCILLFLKKEATFLGGYLSSLFSIPFFLLLYLPLYYRFGEQMLVTFFLLFLTIYASVWFKEWLDRYIPKKKITYLITIVLVVLTYIISGYLTYNPPHIDFFFDGIQEKYGLYDYLV